MSIDIDAIRNRAYGCAARRDRWACEAGVDDQDVIDDLRRAKELAVDDVPALLAEVERLRTEFAELKAALHDLTVSTDGDDLDDAEEIPVGEIRRVVGEAGGW